MDEEGVCDYWRDTYLGPKHFISLCFANSIEDVLRNYFLRFAKYQNVVLRCLGNVLSIANAALALAKREKLLTP